MAPSPEIPESCTDCLKPAVLCVCDRITPMRARTQVLILQHPQEMDQTLGTARLTALMLEGTKVVPGLSWASLSHALGREVDPKRWGVLYLGSLPRELTPEQAQKPLVVLDRKGDERDVRREPLEGIVVLDGTWSQAKTLWWRNPWMLKLNRVVLHPKEPSAYGRLREQPRRGALSTLEAVAETLDALGEDPEIRKRMKSVFRTLLQRARDAQKAGLPGAPAAPAKKGQARRGRTPRSRGGGPMD
jgi:hypothetical protein